MTDISKDFPIHEDWEEYYLFLEALRRTGVCNMRSAGIYLKEAFPISEKQSTAILANWMHNYSELSIKYNWN